MDSAAPIIELQPGSGIIGLSFGATRDAVHCFFGAPQFSELSPIGYEADYWHGVTAHYTHDQTLEALELRPPMACNLNGQQFSGMPIDEAAALVRELDPNVLVAPFAAHSAALCLTVSEAPQGNVVIVVD